MSIHQDTVQFKVLPYSTVLNATLYDDCPIPVTVTTITSLTNDINV